MPDAATATISQGKPLREAPKKVSTSDVQEIGTSAERIAETDRCAPDLYHSPMVQKMALWNARQTQQAERCGDDLTETRQIRVRAVLNSHT